MNKEELLNLIESVKIDSNEFTILSSGALVLRGILEFAHDLDIAVTDKGLNQLKENYNLIKKDNGWYIVTENIECVPDDMENKKEKYENYYLQDINDYLKFIKSSGRKKDIDRIPIVEEYVKNMTYK